MSGICRWLSAYGWSNGVKSISSPLDFRVRVGEGTYVHGAVTVGGDDANIKACLLIVIILL